MTRPNHTTRSRGRRPAFTIVELMVVVGIIVLLVSVAVPSFNAMSYSTTRSLAENSLRRSVTVARDISLRSSQGGDGAIVFVFDPGGQMRIVPAEQVGTFKDAVPDAGANGVGGINEPPFNGFFGQFINRDVFVPSGLAESIALPANWNVRGFAPGGLMLDALNSGREIAEWYNTDTYGGTDTSSLTKIQGNWVFPETGFYDQNLAVTPGGVTGRQSFMVRFDAQTGAVSSSRRSGVLVDPRPSEQDRDAYNPADRRRAWTRVDKADDLSVWATRAIRDANPDADNSYYNDQDFRERSRLVGSVSNDTVLVRPVSRLALADERRLAAGIGANGLNRETRSLYQPYEGANPRIAMDEALFRGGFDPDTIRQNINAWISGDTAGGPGSARGGRPDQLIGDGEINFDEASGPVDQPEASVFSLSPYTGELLELDP